jgi:hypothetical protein
MVGEIIIHGKPVKETGAFSVEKTPVFDISDKKVSSIVHKNNSCMFCLLLLPLHNNLRVAFC